MKTIPTYFIYLVIFKQYKYITEPAIVTEKTTTEVVTTKPVSSTSATESTTNPVVVVQTTVKGKFEIF